MRLGDCVRCGGATGRKNSDLCHRCRADDRETARRATCPTCGEFLRLLNDTGRCLRCSHVCVTCGQVLRFKHSVRCKDCRRRHDATTAKEPCPRCGRDGFIRPATSWCGPCSNPGGIPKPARPCGQCGDVVRRLSNGLCGRCWQRHPDRPRNQADRLAVSLPDPPWWLGEFADHAAQSHCIARACMMITTLGRLLRDDQPNHPQAVLERARWSGRSAGPLARTLEDFFVEHQLAFGLDQTARLATARRQRRVQTTPAALRPTVERFCDHLVRSQERAHRAGTRPRADSTIEGTIAIVRDFAVFLAEPLGKQDWAIVQTADIEAFLNTRAGNQRRTLTGLRQFFAWARRYKIVLVDPARTIPVVSRRGFIGETLTIAKQRQLFRRWTTSTDPHPHEAAVGLLGLLHAFTNSELRGLKICDINHDARNLHVDGRPHPVPLDPASLASIERCIEHRVRLGTRNPHLIVTKVTKPRTTPASSAYLTHVLDPVNVSIKTLRSTRLLDLVISLDPKLVAEALGMDADGLLDYLADHVDQDRISQLPTQPNP